MKLKKLIASAISFVMLAASIQPCFAATVNEVTPSWIPNPLTLDLAVDVLAKKSGDTTYTSSLSIIDTASVGVDYKTTLNMEPVRNIFNGVVISNLISQDSEAQAEFDAGTVETTVAITINYPADAVLSDDILTSGDIDNAFFNEVNRTQSGNSVTITYNNDTITAGDLAADVENKLSNITFALDGKVSYAQQGTYPIAVSMSGSTTITFASRVQTVNYSGNGSHTTTYQTKTSPGGTSDFTVRFNSNGGSSVDSVTLKYGGTFTAPVPTRDGYTFAGWYTDSALENEFTSGTRVTSNMTLYAKWNKTDDLPGPTEPSASTIIDGEKIDVPITEVDGKYTLDVDALDVPEKEGFAFAGWYTDSSFNNEVTGVIEITGETNLYPSYVNLTAPKSLISDEHIAYIQGYPDGEIKPNGYITREEVVAALYRLLDPARKAEIETSTNPFPDVNSDRWSNTEVSTMANGGYIEGDENGYFNPAKSITRAEFVTIAVKLMDSNIDTPNANYFSDVTGHWAENSILKAAYELYWIAGYEDATFRPDDYITRAEAITIINRMLVRYGDNTATDVSNWPDVSESDWYYTSIIEATTDNHNFDRQENGWSENWN